ncbi:reelin-like [Penaeus chinensis]|uniref:reelin-like n=1 Tax=Penaeus chinensis TaxID=139456 RepID=UPI001FB5E21B|nr:reelin-like [Penaeus chinensis]
MPLMVVWKGCRSNENPNSFNVSRDTTLHDEPPSGSGEVHLQVIPLRFRRRGVCVGWRSAPIGGNASACWSLDDVALATHESSSEPIIDDFDPVDPSHWFFFPGASVKEYCSSEGNSLVFEGEDAASWLSTRLLDLSAAPPPEDVAVRQRFLDFIPHGWEVTGGLVAKCGNEASLVMAGGGRRRVCSPFLDARNIGTVALKMQLGECHTSHSQRVSVDVFAEHGTFRTLLRHYLLSWTLDTYTIPVQKENQLHHTR